MKTRGRKIYRDVTTRRGRTFMASMSIFIGVLGVVILVSTADLLTRQLNEDIQLGDLPMLYLFLTTAGSQDIDNADYIETLQNIEGVTDVSGRAVNAISWKPPSDAPPSADDDDFNRAFLLASFEPFDEMTLQPMRLIEGQYPTSGQKQIAIEQRMADRYGLSLGDSIIVRVLGDQSPPADAPPPRNNDDDGPREETWTISGIVFQPYPSLVLGTGSGAGIIPGNQSLFATFEDTEYITGLSGFSSLFVRFDDFETAITQRDDFLETFGDVTPYVPVFSLLDNPNNSIVTRTVSQITNVLVFLGVVAMIVSGFLVTNIINTIMVEQKNQVGVLKSLGATRVDSLQMYIGVALSYGVLGMIPAVLIGVPVGYIMTTIVAAQANTLIDGFRISPAGVGLGVMMGLFIPLLAAAIPIINGTRISILEAMTDLGIVADYGNGPVARSLSVAPFPRNIKQALSNVLRNKGRLALTVLTLTLAIAAFMGVFAMLTSISDFIQDTFSSYDFQIQVTPNESVDLSRARSAILSQVDAVQDVYPGVNVEAAYPEFNNAANGNNTLFTRGFATQSEAFELDLVAGTAWRDDPNREGVVLPENIAGFLGKNVGDTVQIQFGNNVTEQEVIGIYETRGTQVIMNWRQLAALTGSVLGAPVPNQYLTTLEVDGYESTDTGDGSVTALGIEVNMLVQRFLDTADQLLGETPGVIITTHMADAGGYSVGDTLTLTGTSDDATSKTYPIVDVISPEPLLFLIPEGIEPPNDGIGIHWLELAALEGRDLEGEPAPNQLYIQLKDDDATIDEIDRVMRDVSEALRVAGIGARLTNSVQQTQQTAQLALSLGVIFGITALVMALVGMVGLLATLAMSVFERQKEIGVMRSIGASSSLIATQFVTEGLVIGVLSWLIAIPLSYSLSELLEATISGIGITNLAYPPVTLLVGLVGTIAMTIIASLSPALNAASKTVSEIIRYQ